MLSETPDSFARAFCVSPQCFLTIFGLLSLAYYCVRDEYSLIRELPIGKGYANMVFVPYRFSNRSAMIVGLKRDQSVDGAIAKKKKWALCVVLTIVEE